ncbi:protein of unknown function [Pilibacter termitis]|jgi:hypothetical protein|uniref:DUF4352 domain-containing protein n=1 Tax=Pilibacter termitis TaxID=263852 RepID=A0A1T4LLW1_9ENTE|nr:DUF4190 domain-containing protein [Pilibacter termitis]SJZ55730.1 protein of unknown function [Pilibacter termitis]
MTDREREKLERRKRLEALSNSEKEELLLRLKEIKAKREKKERKGNSGLAITSLVLGIIGIIGCVVPILNNISFFFGLLAFVFGLIAVLRAKKTNFKNNLGKAGLILAILTMAGVLISQAYYAHLFNKIDKGLESISKDIEKETDLPETSKEAKKENFTIGQEFTVGRVTYKINSTEIVDEIKTGNELLDAKARAKFLVLNVTVTNNGDKELLVSSSFFKLKLGKKIYESAEYSANSAANYSENGEELFFKGINPDVSITGNVVFDVQEDVLKNKDLLLQVQTGVFGTETGFVTLNK